MPLVIDLDGEKAFPFISRYKRLTEVLTDRELAALGDAYINFVYSLALSKKAGKPIGRKVDSSTLASALRKANLRRFLASRTDRHKQADAAEALIVYAWLTGAISVKETLDAMEREEVEENAFSLVLQRVLEKIDLNISVDV